MLNPGDKLGFCFELCCFIARGGFLRSGGVLAKVGILGEVRYSSETTPKPP